jgi:putative transposase
LVNREFEASAPNQLWVAAFPYAATWKGFVYVAFVIDVFARMMVGWRLSSSMNTDLNLAALEQVLWVRRMKSRPVHHSAR